MELYIEHRLPREPASGKFEGRVPAAPVPRLREIALFIFSARSPREPASGRLEGLQQKLIATQKLDIDAND
jgi:hypothetical protein